MELEDGAIQTAAPKYDSIFRRVIAELETRDALELPSESFFENLSEDFRRIGEDLGSGIFAAYLLGYDSSREETVAQIDFAEGDDDNRAEKAGDLDLRFDVAPDEAIDYFKLKQILKPDDFNKLEREAKSAAFTVSGIYKEDVLTAFRDEITTALKTGQTQKTTVDNFKKILDGAGHKELGDFHLESVFRSNMQTAYGVGRRRQMEETADILPFWEYSAVGDDRTRPTHRALDGIIFPANHEFWDTHYCPWDFQCRCTVIARLDMPSDYDHAKPNADTTIVYDENGLPAKAEYRTQVVDLKATKFAGVPKQNGGLQRIIEDNANSSGKVSSLQVGKLESVEEIERWAEETFPHVQFDFEGAVVETIKPTMKEFSELAKQYPQVVERLEYVGTYRNKLKTNHGKRKDFHFNGENQTHIAHASMTDGKVIGLNPRFFGDLARMKEADRQSEAINWTVSGKIETTIAHEFGHLVDGWLKSLGAKDVVNASRLDGSTSFFDAVLERWTKHRVTSAKELSRYALTERAETFAESFAAIRHRPKSTWCKYTKLQKRLLDDVRRLVLPENPRSWSVLSAEERAEALKKLDEFKKKFNYLD